jgi:NAD+ synthase (glutamine-hydrolysing)
VTEKITCAVASLNQVPLDWFGNRRRVIDSITLSRQYGAQFLCLPELSVTGYGCEDMFFSPELHERVKESIEIIAEATEGMCVVVGAPWVYDGSLWNCAYVLVDGSLKAIVPKCNLPGDGVHYENRWFKQWQSGVRFELSHGVIGGDTLLTVGGITCGFEICEDAWVPWGPLHRLARGNLDLLFCPSASHFAFNKHLIRRKFVEEGSRAASCAFLHANLLGCESGRTIYDGHSCIATGGVITAETARLTFDEISLVTTRIDLHAQRVARWRITSAPLPREAQRGTLLVNLPLWPCHEERTLSVAPRQNEDVYTQFVDSVTLGLFDYARKSKASGFTLSLSGGADSSCVAVLIAFLVKRIYALDNDRERDRILACLFDDAPLPKEEKEAMGRLLCCVYQKTVNSSSRTEEAAHRLANEIGASFASVDISSLVTDYTTLGESILGRPLTWEGDDVALQNIQSRVRSPLIWLIANVRRSLLLTTGNRSEGSVGYVTMDGDSSGGLNPLAGVSKEFILRFLHWAQVTFPSLSFVTSQEPTAELRPSHYRQKDEDDLMPYAVLDKIERAFVLHKKSPREIVALLIEQSHSRSDAVRYVRRFFSLWSVSQWKRERFAPSFHLDDYSLDPRSWCRFPILSAGFQEELNELL